MESRNKLLRLLDSVIDALVWAISKLGLSTQQQTLRLGHLTMLLSHIRHVRYGPSGEHAETLGYPGQRSVSVINTLQQTHRTSTTRMNKHMQGGGAFERRPKEG